MMKGRPEVLQQAILQLRALLLFLLVVLILLPLVLLFGDTVFNSVKHELAVRFNPVEIPESISAAKYWSPPQLDSVTDPQRKTQLEYGKELVTHTALYLGPKGSIKPISNGMNCQNCHLESGTKVFGNNFSAVAVTYPKFRARSNSLEDIYKRVNDCFVRSLNGQPLDTLSPEMQAIKAYILFLGSNVEPKTIPEGSGLKDLAYLKREADPVKGKVVFEEKCMRCHQANGEGQLALNGKEYTYPPLWGNHSFNDAAGLYRITPFARYIKYNMPQGVSHAFPLLTDEEAWDVASYVLSQPRPHKEMPMDWPDISKKPVDHPFGPYSDGFSSHQHKFGPFEPILEAQKNMTTKARQ